MEKNRARFFTPEYEAMVRRRISPKYIDTIGTESYERAILVAVIDELRAKLALRAKPKPLPDDGDPFMLETMALAVGAVHYSPPPLRSVQGVSLTFDQLAQFTQCMQTLALREAIKIAQRGEWGLTKTGRAIAAAITRHTEGQ
jgi:hypothetical protein